MTRTDYLVYVDRPKRIVINIATGWNDITKGEIVVHSQAEDVKFLLSCHVSQYDDGIPLFILADNRSRERIESRDKL